MNILHMTYAVEVAKTGSINKASETLLMAQPNLSRSIKELESNLGITIFNRSSKGMTLTSEGEEFIGYAKKILKEIDEVEGMYKGEISAKQKFSISVPRASYISDAFARFSTNISDDPAEIYYNETNSSHTINNILSSEYNLGIVRYAADFDKYFKNMFEDKGLTYELVADFNYVLIMHRENTLACLPSICLSDLGSYIEIAHADPFVPSLALAAVRKEELPDTVRRRIFVFERGSQFCLLSQNKETFMWVSPIPTHLLDRYQLVQKECADNKRIYKDVLIYRRDYRLSKLDKQFITELCTSRRRYL